jgi:hypothetical protein
LNIINYNDYKVLNFESDRIDLKDMSGRARKENKKNNPEISISKESEITDSIVATEFAELKTRMDIIDAKLKLMSDKLTPVNLNGIENKMTYLEKIEDINSNLLILKNELHNLNAYAKIFFGIGAAALLIYCINGILGILSYLRPIK